MIGQTLSHYRIVEKLGEGGMGVVYRAVDTRLNRPVAIKVLPPEAMADGERSRRFVQEARAASALNHPNIITVYDVDAAGGVTFIAMEYVAGQTLSEAIGRRGLTLSDALKYGIQIADALATAHAAGIVHRDLKPANVMITETGRIKVLDFGVAKLTERVDLGATQAATVDAVPRTEEGTILGTVAYMSPEQAEGKKVDARSDIFSFGSLLYEMVTARRAFQRETKVSTLAAILHTEPQPASEIAEGTPRELDRIIAHCLRKDSARRFQHLDDVKTLLEQLEGESGSEKLATEPRDEAAKARMRLTSVVAVATVLVAVIAGVVWWLARDRARGSAPGSAVQSAAATGTTTPSVTATRPRLSSGGPASTNPEANRYFELAMQSVKVNYDVPRARRMLEQALELDDHFAEARAWYGFTDWFLLDDGSSNDGALLYKAEEEMRRALQDEPSLARAHVGFANVFFAQGRRELIPAEVEQVLKANPEDEDALYLRMEYYHYLGEYAAAERVGQQVLTRLPLFVPVRMILGEILREQGDLAGAVREQQRLLDQDPGNSLAIRYLARAYLDSGDLVQARRTLSRARPADQSNYWIRLLRAMLLLLEGRRSEALREADEEVQKWGALLAYVSPEMAAFHAVAGNASQALDWLDRAVRTGDERAEWFRRDPLLASVRNDPRFQQILESIAYRRQQRKPLQ